MRKIIFITFLLLSVNIFSQEHLLAIVQQQSEPAVILSAKTIARPNCYNKSITWNAGDEYTPTNSTDLSNAANAGKVAIINNSFSVSGITLAANQIIVPQGGVLTGTNINLNGATIYANNQQAFYHSVTFSSLYTNGCLTPELFGAVTADTAFDDANAIEAMFNNGVAGINQSSGVYNFDSQKTISRGGIFQWSGNNSKISISTKLNATGSSSAMLTWNNQTRHEFTDLEIDGNNILERFTYVEYSDFAHDNVYIHNLMSTTRLDGDRVTAYTVAFDPALANDFKIYNSRYDDFECWGQGVAASGTDGITKVFWFLYREILTSSIGSIDIYNVDSTNILGEDAEFMFTAASTNGSEFNHNIIVTIQNSRFTNMTRRFIKGVQSNIRIDNCVFTRLPNVAIGGNLSEPTSGVAISGADPYNALKLNQGSWIRNSTFIQTGGNADAQHIHIDSSTGVEISGNTISFENPSNEGGITIRQDAINLNIFNNTFTNAGLMPSTFSNSSITVNDNVFNYTIDGTNFQSAIIRSGSTTSTMRKMTFEDNEVNIEYKTNSGNFAGILGASWVSVIVEDMLIQNNIINISGVNKSGQWMADIESDFGSSNSLLNNTWNGIDSTNVWNIEGTQGFTNTGNTGLVIQ